MTRLPASSLKGRPPPRKCPADFDVIFVEQGRIGCEQWYRARRTTIDRWLDERGKDALIAARSAYVKALRSRGEWITRQTRMVTHQDVRPKRQTGPVRDRRIIGPNLARHAAQHLRIVRNGGFIVSPTGQGDWWIGSRRLSAAQMVELAETKGFDRKGSEHQEQQEEQPDFLIDRPELLGIAHARLAQRPDTSTYIPNAAKRRKIKRARTNLQADDGEGVEG